MMSNDGPKKRACDGCRMRKRKCDGLLPYCTNCQKSSVKSAEGLPLCTYDLAVKKRGQKKGYKENLIQRLETLEAVLNPFDRSLESAGSSANSIVVMDTEWQGAGNTTADSLHSDKSLDYVAEQAIMVATQQMQNQQMAQYQTEFSVSMDNHNQSPQHKPIDLVMLGQGSPTLSMGSVNDEDFQLSLLRLGIQYCTTLNSFRLSLFLRENSDMSLIAPSLKLGLCAHGLFYSKHPYLFSLIRMTNPNNGVLPIHEIADQYLEQAINLLPARPSSEMELIDTVRACLVISTCLLVINKPGKGRAIKGRLHNLIKDYHLFDPFLFNPVPSASGYTADFLMSDFGTTNRFVPPNLTDEELNERFSLWEEVMSIDTFFALMSGNDFNYDESMYPRGFNNPALDGTSQVDMDLNQVVDPPLTQYRFAQNTIWANTSYAKAFDDMREMSAISSLYFIGGLVQYRLSIMRIGRRAIRFARECEKGESHRFPTDSHYSINEMFISLMDNLPKSFMPFESLEKFAQEPSTTSCFHSKWTSHLCFFQDLLMFLASMTYIHVPLFKSSDILFNLSPNSVHKFTSQDILITLLRAAMAMVKHLYTVSGQVVEDSVPVPGLCSTTASSALYLISSSAIVASRDNTPILRKEVDDMVLQWVCPAIEKIGGVKVMARKQAEKLRLLIAH